MSVNLSTVHPATRPIDAMKIRGVTVAETAIQNGQTYIYNSTTGLLEPGNVSSGGIAFTFSTADPTGGNLGDCHLRTDTGVFFKKETVESVDTWVSKYTITGGSGGSSMYFGSGAPNSGTGALNDTYLDTTGGEIYKKETVNSVDTWVSKYVFGSGSGLTEEQSAAIASIPLNLDKRVIRNEDRVNNLLTSDDDKIVRFSAPSSTMKLLLTGEDFTDRSGTFASSVLHVTTGQVIEGSNNCNIPHNTVLNSGGKWGKGSFSRTMAISGLEAVMPLSGTDGSFIIGAWIKFPSVAVMDSYATTYGSWPLFEMNNGGDSGWGSLKEIVGLWMSYHSVGISPHNYGEDGTDVSAYMDKWTYVEASGHISGGVYRNAIFFDGNLISVHDHTSFMSSSNPFSLFKFPDVHLNIGCGYTNYSSALNCDIPPIIEFSDFNLIVGDYKNYATAPHAIPTGAIAEVVRDYRISDVKVSELLPREEFDILELPVDAKKKLIQDKAENFYQETDIGKIVAITGTAPQGNDSKTQILLHFSNNAFVDSSSNNATSTYVTAEWANNTYYTASGKFSGGLIVGGADMGYNYLAYDNTNKRYDRRGDWCIDFWYKNQYGIDYYMGHTYPTLLFGCGSSSANWRINVSGDMNTETYEQNSTHLSFVAPGINVYCELFGLVNIFDNTFHHLMLSVKNNVWQWYVDGVAYGTPVTNTTLTDVSGRLLFGGHDQFNSSGMGCSFTMDEFRISSTYRKDADFSASLPTSEYIGGNQDFHVSNLSFLLNGTDLQLRIDNGNGTFNTYTLTKDV